MYKISLILLEAWVLAQGGSVRGPRVAATLAVQPFSAVTAMTGAYPY